MVNPWRPELLLALLLGCAPSFDQDGDGWAEGLDCNDNDAAVFPGSGDPAGDDVDQDCDGVDGQDADGDGFDPFDADESRRDCDDSDAAIQPGISDIPFDGIDQNCDGFDRLFARFEQEADGFDPPAVTQDGGILNPAVWGPVQDIGTLPPSGTTLWLTGQMQQLGESSWYDSDRDGYRFRVDDGQAVQLLIELDWTAGDTDLDLALFCEADGQQQWPMVPSIADSSQPEVGGTITTLPANTECNVAVLGYFGNPTPYWLLITAFPTE